MAAQDPQFEPFRWAVVASPALVASILAALWLAGAPARRPDLRFSAPVVAHPGQSIGLRAWAVEETVGSAQIEAPEVEVELVARGGRTLARAVLAKSRAQGSEGKLLVPEGLDDVLTLRARATTTGGTAVSVDRDLYVQASIQSPAQRGRSVSPFQAYELEPIVVARGAPPDVILDPRIEEGVCVPDLRCWLSVWIGTREARVRVTPIAGLTMAPTVRLARNGFARFPVIVRGNEARIEVQLLSEEGSLLATRRARLPVVPGGLVAHASVDARRVFVQWDEIGGPGPVLLDLFDGDRWVDATSLEPGDSAWIEPGPGVWRIQVRRDLFSEGTAAVAYAVVSGPGGPSSEREAAEAMVAEAGREGLDPLALAVLDGDVPHASAENAMRALFAIASFDVVSTGPGASSRVGENGALRLDQERKRWWAAGAIMLIGLLVSMVLLRVELLARADARRLLETLGDDAQPAPRRLIPAVGLWVLVLLAFVVMAVLALSKRWF